jgi:hypothetical protein
MPVSSKAVIKVEAGVILGEPMAQYTKQWEYDSGDYELDRKTPGDMPTIFSLRLSEAHDYAMGLSNPRYVNWVRIDWIWI